MCGAPETVVYAEQGQSVHLLDSVGSAVSLASLNQVMAGIAMMLVIGAILATGKVVRRHQRSSGDMMERGMFLRSQYEEEEEEEDEDTEDEQMHVE